MAENCTTFAKKRLKNSDLLLRTIPYREDEILVLVTLCVKNYRNLKKNIIYYVSAKVNEYTWTNKLVKVNGTLFFFMSSNSNAKIHSVYICKVQGDFLRNENILQRESLLILEFCDKAIEDSTDEYLHGYSLLIELKYSVERSKHDDCSSNFRAFQTLKDHTVHCVDFSCLYFSHLRHNLKVLTGHRRFHCHIAVFAKHSKVFAAFKEEKNLLPYKKYCIAIKEDPFYVQIVINYMYSGRFYSLVVEKMKGLYQVAKRLQIDSLMKKCIEHLESNLSSSMK